MSSHVHQLLNEELGRLSALIKSTEEDLKELKKKQFQTREALAQLTPAESAVASMSGYGSLTATASMREGTLKEIILGYLKTAESGVNGSELDKIIRDIRPTTGENSVFSTLSRLKNEGLLEKGTDGKWRATSSQLRIQMNDPPLAESAEVKYVDSDTEDFC